MGADPPSVGVAVKLTVLPGQNGFASGVITTDAICDAITCWVMAFEVAVTGSGQVAFDIIRQLTTSLCVG